MSNNIKNIKKAVSNTAQVATSSIEISTEVIGDASKLAAGTIRGVLPVTKSLGSICGLFIAGMVNYDSTPEQAKAIYDNTSVSSVLAALEVAALEAGQAMMKDEEEDVSADTLKARIFEQEAQLAAK